MSTNLIQGIAPDGTIRAIAVAQDGSLVTSGGGGGGAGGGDASAANQQVQTSLLEIIRDRLSSITTATDTLESLIISLNSYVDGLEGLLTSALATQGAISGFVDQLEAYTDGIEANQASAIAATSEIRNRLPSALVNNRLVVDGSGVTQPISATTLPLPNNAATDATLVAIRDRLPSLLATGRFVVDGSSVTQPVSGNINVSNFPATQPVSGSVSVANFPTTQTIAGNVAVSNLPATQAISATALPLPTGAATDSTVGLVATRIGNTSDTTGTTDTGTFSLIALIKRLLSIKLPSALSNDRFKTEALIATTARVTSFINTTTTGLVAAGANSVAIANIGSAAGTVKGVNLPPGCAISFAANGSDTLDAISYVATGTIFLITTVV